MQGINATGCREDDHKDLRPEYREYHDEGCEVSTSCLECSFTQCIYDGPRGNRRLLKTVRDRQIAGLFYAGKNSAELSRMFGVSRRTVQRIIKNPKRYQNSIGQTFVLIASVLLIPILQFAQDAV